MKPSHRHLISDWPPLLHLLALPTWNSNLYRISILENRDICDCKLCRLRKMYLKASSQKFSFMPLCMRPSMQYLFLQKNILFENLKNTNITYLQRWLNFFKNCCHRVSFKAEACIRQVRCINNVHILITMLVFEKKVAPNNITLNCCYHVWF